MTATSSSTRLEFQGGGTSDGKSALLDNVQVREILSTTATIALEQNTYSVNEANGVLEFAVVCSGNTSTSASVEYEIYDGTATLRTDFNGTDGTDGRVGTIHFAPGETRKTGNISIINDMSTQFIQFLPSRFGRFLVYFLNQTIFRIAPSTLFLPHLSNLSASGRP
ncbi:hypothetical protein WA1_32700 [Scytonema hofmannii PCC 7110]|uniref:Calx-beta domain-containing protein n=1 Tax=Scytonema hofmannii PCC 7110 TaxID=128403 RepID=A0A139X445_9CYAN|nr:Calx-beta domain-containing protein [Scytonema hofmannii]KYC39479.1 hypothetical protein WA1_32700 [Scytonema hofmannii PCC 7110]